jgi:hypothetical protein
MNLEELKEDGARITVDSCREYIWHLSFEEKAVRFRNASAAQSHSLSSRFTDCGGSFHVLTMQSWAVVDSAVKALQFYAVKQALRNDRATVNVRKDPGVATVLTQLRKDVASRFMRCVPLPVVYMPYVFTRGKQPMTPCGGLSRCKQLNPV